MILEIFGSQTAPVLLDMKAAVGNWGTNSRNDVSLVQSLLVACDGMARPGAPPLVKIDGLIGPRTIAAITAYQKANGLKADGIVGPRGETIHSLLQTLQSANRPLPQGPGLIPAPANTAAAFAGTSMIASHLKRPVDSIGSTFGVPFTRTSWRIKSSTTLDIGWKDKGAFVADLEIVDDDDPAAAPVKVKIRAVLAMASLGSPFALDVSKPDYPSTGGRVVRGLGGIAFTRTSFFGICGVSLMGFEAGVGYGCTLYQFGWAPSPPGMCTGFALTAGYQKGAPASMGVASGPGVATPI